MAGRRRRGKGKNSNKKNNSKVTTLTVYKQRNTDPANGKPYPKRNPKLNREMGRKLGMDMMAAHKLCAISNPFCPEAIGAKIPDENATPGLFYQCRMIWPVTTLATASYCAYVSPNQIQAVYEGTAVTAAGVATTWGGATASDFYSGIGATVKQYRIVSWGLRFMTTCSWTSATGLIQFSEVIGNPTGIVNLGTVGNNISLSERTVPFRDCKMTFVGRPNGVEATSYQNYNGTSANGYTGVVIGIIGAPIGAVGYMEIFWNIEWIPSTAAYGMFLTPAAKFDPLAMRARVELLKDRDATEPTDPPEGWDFKWVKKAAAAIGDTVTEVVSTVETVQSYGPTALKAAKLGGMLLAYA